MKIALLGYGKMGQMVEQIAQNMGHSVLGHCTSTKWDATAVKEADVCIDFTQPRAVVQNIARVIEYKKPIVIGTTGWFDAIEQVRSEVVQNKIGLLYGSNFSIGILLFIKMVQYASRIVGPEYDIAGIEYHHNQKKDSPSGTAQEIIKACDRDISFSSVRCGSIPGSHTVLFDSPCDTISLTHTARTREGFAQGAIWAAQWLIGKKGIYSFQECIEDSIQRRRDV